MRILIYSRAFRPNIGGLESVAEMLARGFAEREHEVTVATATAADDDAPGPYAVKRVPTLAELWRHARRADVCLSMNISLRGILPLQLAGCPLVVSHHSWYTGSGSHPAIAALKIAESRLVTNIFCSRAVSQRIGVPGVHIPNAYDDDLFRADDDTARDKDLVFVGRLVSEKGVEDLLQALAFLRDKGRRPLLTIIGGGPEEPNLRVSSQNLALDDQVTFLGPLRGASLAAEISRHAVMVVPSRCEETFGIVALEGAACGCIVVGTDGGGLPEAIGPCGLLARRGDPGDLATKIDLALTDAGVRQAARLNAPKHLAAHSRDQMVSRYLDVLACAAHPAVLGQRRV